MKKKFFQKYRAFSLAELLLAIAIIGIMSAILFTSLSSNRSASRLKAAQREVASTIKLAQTYALQGNKQGGVTPCGYGFRFSIKTQYEIFYNLPGPGVGNDCESRNGNSAFRQFGGFSDVAESYSLKNSVTLSTDPSLTEVYFTVPHATAFDNGGMEFGSPLVLTLDLSGVTKTVTFSAGGSISESP